MSDRNNAPQCPNCADGRMSIVADGCLWCDRCEIASQDDNVEDLATLICANLPQGMSRLDYLRFKNRAASLIRGFVASAVQKAREGSR